MPSTRTNLDRSPRQRTKRGSAARPLVLPRLVVTALLAATLAGCSTGGAGSGPAASPTSTVDESKPHIHGPGNENISLLVGDGTRDSEVGYTLGGLTLPKAAGVPGRLSFQIKLYDGSALTDYITDQTKDLHLYLVRTDYAVFRHLHPTLGRDGTWTAPVTLPQPGDYRVIAEFVARDSGGDGDHVMLGATGTVPGPWSPEDAAASDVGDDGVVSVVVDREPALGPAGRLDIVVRDASGRPVKLGTYLGTFAHVTGFHLASGAVVHMHPLGQPESDDTGTRLSFHTAFEKPGEYLCFVQLRVDGFLHTVPVTFRVT